MITTIGEKLIKNLVNVNLEDFNNSNCTVGISVLSVLKTISVTFEFKKDNKYYSYNHYFTTKLIEDDNVTICYSKIVDSELIKKYISDIENKYNLNIKAICYDPFCSLNLANYFIEFGYNCVEVRQGAQSLNETTRNLDAIYFNDDSLIKEALRNIQILNIIDKLIVNPKSKNSYAIQSVVNSHYGAIKVL